jgi:hypothetical protein
MVFNNVKLEFSQEWSLKLKNKYEASIYSVIWVSLANPIITIFQFTKSDQHSFAPPKAAGFNATTILLWYSSGFLIARRSNLGLNGTLGGYQIYKYLAASDVGTYCVFTSMDITINN